MSYSTRDLSLDGGDTVKFRPSSASGAAPKNFLKDSLVLQDRTFFHTSTYLLEKNWFSFYMKISSEM